MDYNQYFEIFRLVTMKQSAKSLICANKRKKSKTQWKRLLIPAKTLKTNSNMRMQLNRAETDYLLSAVHYYVMHMREMEATGSEDYTALIGIEKFLLDSISLDLTDNLPF